MKKYLLPLLCAFTISLGAALPTAAFADSHNKADQQTTSQSQHVGKCNKKSPCNCKHMKKMWQQLNLTDQQKNKIQAVKKQARSDMQKAREAMHENDQAINKLIASDKPDQAAIKKLVQKHAQLSAQLKQQRIDKRMKIQAMLTPDQKKQLQSLMAKKMDNMKNRKQCH